MFAIIIVESESNAKIYMSITYKTFIANIQLLLMKN